jgi:hypothetical protein
MITVLERQILAHDIVTSPKKAHYSQNVGPTDFARRGSEVPGITLKRGISCYFGLDRVEITAACLYLRRLRFKDIVTAVSEPWRKMECVRICRPTMSRRNLER